MFKSVIFISIFLSLRNVPSFADKVEGEGKLCVVQRTKEFGICTHLDRCDYAKNLLKLKKWKRPQQCGSYIGIYPLICCPTPRSEVVCQAFHPPEEPCIDTQISGGENALAREFRHMAALGYGNKDQIKWFCGGSLISSQFVLTAAHCIKTKEYGQVRWVRLGDLDLASTVDDANKQSQPQEFSVIEVYPHEKYKPPVHYHDIGIIKLDRPARFSFYVYPACLHTEVPVPEKLTISGYGKIDLLADSSSHLLKADIFFINYTSCAKSYKNIKARFLPRGIDNEIQVCAGHPNGKDTCPGDSGGPLQYKIVKFNPHYRIAGVTSFGQGCGSGSTAAVYARVSAYLSWIENIVWPSEGFNLEHLR